MANAAAAFDRLWADYGNDSRGNARDTGGGEALELVDYFMQLSLAFLAQVGSTEELDADMWVPNQIPFHGSSTVAPRSSEPNVNVIIE